MSDLILTQVEAQQTRDWTHQNFRLAMLFVKDPNSMHMMLHPLRGITSMLGSPDETVIFLDLTRGMPIEETIVRFRAALEWMEKVAGARDEIKASFPISGGEDTGS